MAKANREASRNECRAWQARMIDTLPFGAAMAADMPLTVEQFEVVCGT